MCKFFTFARNGHNFVVIVYRLVFPVSSFPALSGFFLSCHLFAARSVHNAKRQVHIIQGEGHFGAADSALDNSAPDISAPFHNFFVFFDL